MANASRGTQHPLAARRIIGCCDDQLNPGNYKALAFGARCQQMGVRPLRDTVGDAYDNAVAENYFATLACDRLDRCTYRTHTAAKMDLFQYIEGRYDPHRRQSGLGNRSPINYERLMAQVA